MPEMAEEKFNGFDKSGIVEELATFHDNIIIVVVKSLHSEGACRHDKIIVKKVAE